MRRPHHAGVLSGLPRARAEARVKRRGCQSDGPTVKEAATSGISLFVASGRVDKLDPDANGREQHEGREALDELVISGGDAT
jgi:hypothetical protein